MWNYCKVEAVGMDMLELFRPSGMIGAFELSRPRQDLTRVFPGPVW